MNQLIEAFYNWPIDGHAEVNIFAEFTFGTKENGYGVGINNNHAVPMEPEGYSQNIVLNGENWPTQYWPTETTINEFHWNYIAILEGMCELRFLKDEATAKQKAAMAFQNTDYVQEIKDWKHLHDLEQYYGAMYFRIRDIVALWKKLYEPEGKNAQEREVDTAKKFYQHDLLLLKLKNWWITIRHHEESMEKKCLR